MNGRAVAGAGRAARRGRRRASSEVEELADRVGRPAVVVVERDAPEQVVAGDQQPPLGLVAGRRATARGRASRPRARRRGRVSHLDAGHEVAVGARPGRRCRTALAPARLCPARAAAPRAARRSGARSRCAARAPPRGPRPGGSRARGSGASTARSPRARRSSRPARSGRCARACRRAGARARGAGRPGPARARGARSEPGSCIPQSTSTIPSPAASAHALQCGTPGHGSGRRRRQTPGQHALAAADLALAAWWSSARTIRGLLAPTPWASAAARAGGPSALEAPTSDYTSRRRRRCSRCAGALTPEDPRASTPRRSAGILLSQEDAWQRAVEFLFERLAVRWEIAGRRRARARRSCSCATASRRRTSAAWIRDTLREHLAEHFPDLEAP